MNTLFQKETFSTLVLTAVFVFCLSIGVSLVKTGQWLPVFLILAAFAVVQGVYYKFVLKRFGSTEMIVMGSAALLYVAAVVWNS